jgi:DNA-binding MarR family transcriptional regulator
VRGDAFEAAATARVAETHPSADLLALRASFNLVRLSTLHVHRLESEVHRDAGWSMAGFRVMFCVWVVGELEPREISRFSGLSRAAVSSVLNTLERDGLVERHRESADRRLVTVRLTAEGERRLVAAYDQENAVERSFFAPLGVAELEAFVASMSRLLRQRGDLPD